MPHTFWTIQKSHFNQTSKPILSSSTNATLLLAPKSPKINLKYKTQILNISPNVNVGSLWFSLPRKKYYRSGDIC